MPVVSLRPTQQGKGLTKPKSKIRLRLGLTPPHPTAPKHESPVPALPSISKDSIKLAPIPPFKPTNPTTNGLATSTSTNRTSISRVDSRSAFTYDTSPSIASNDNNEYDYGQYQDDTSAQFQEISLSSHSPNHPNPMMYPSANDSRATIQSNASGMDPNLARHYYYPTPERTEPEVEDDAGLRHPHLQAYVNQSDDIFMMTDQMLCERFSFAHEIGFGNWGSVWVGKPRHYRASTLEKRIPGGRMGRMAAASGGYGAGGKVAFKLIYREKTAVSYSYIQVEWKLMVGDCCSSTSFMGRNENHQDFTIGTSSEHHHIRSIYHYRFFRHVSPFPMYVVQS